MRVNNVALKTLRLLGGESQLSLATRAGISERSYNKIENGHAQPRPATVKKLAEALGVPVREIVTVVQDADPEFTPARRAS